MKQAEGPQPFDAIERSLAVNDTDRVQYEEGMVSFLGIRTYGLRIVGPGQGSTNNTRK